MTNDLGRSMATDAIDHMIVAVHLPNDSPHATDPANRRGIVAAHRNQPRGYGVDSSARSLAHHGDAARVHSLGCVATAHSQGYGVDDHSLGCDDIAHSSDFVANDRSPDYSDDNPGLGCVGAAQDWATDVVAPYQVAARRWRRQWPG